MTRRVLKRLIALSVFLGIWCVLPAASSQKPAQPQGPQSSLFPPPPPTDDPADADITDLANAAYNENVASIDGTIIALASGSFYEWVFAQEMCAYFGISPCPPTLDPPAPPPTPPSTPEKPKEDSTPKNQDVIPINGDSSTPVDEVIGGEPEPPALLSGPSVADVTPAALPGPVMIVVAGDSGVMEMRVYSPTALSTEARRRLLQVRGVLAPVAPMAARRITERLSSIAAPGAGVHLTRVPLRTYCVEAGNRAPAKGALYLLASPSTQTRFAPMQNIRSVAEFAARRGSLRPQGDAATYGRFIAQYAIWTRLEHWDRARFTNEFLMRTRQEMNAARRPWTSETEQTLRALAPARWRDVRLVIRATDEAQARARAKSASRGTE